jgi:phosphoglycolate phosphatase-like HAD superfamily hydrolase
MRAYVFDIDGTLADATHRLHHIQKQPKDWDAFHAGTDKDAPISHIIQVAMTLGLGTPIVLCTGRPEHTREATNRWLIEHGLYTVVHKLYMRADGDHRTEFEVKRDILQVMRADGWQPIMVWDNRDQSVKFWRDAGIPCAQVDEGTF